MTPIVVLDELVVPPELVGVQVYIPISVVLILDIVRVEPVSPVITIPFLYH